MYGKVSMFLLVGIALALLIWTYPEQSQPTGSPTVSHQFPDLRSQTPEPNGATLAQVPARSPEPVEAPKSGSINFRGLALDQDGYPISDLPLVLAASGEQSRRVSTGRQGEFSFTGLDTGRYTLQSEDPDYALSGSAEFPVERGGEELIFHFHSLIEVRGVILDPFGNTVANASVYTQGIAAPSLFASETAQSDTAGQFRLRVPFERRAAAQMASLAISNPERAVNTDICLIIEHGEYQTAGQMLSLSSGKTDIGHVWLKTKATLVDVQETTFPCSDP
jgi:hypothetical protein